MTTESEDSFEQALNALGKPERDVLALLALSGAMNITRLTALANAAGLRETPSRQLSAARMRAHMEALTKANLVRPVERDGLAVQRQVKFPALRDAASRGRLNNLAAAVSATRNDARSSLQVELRAEKTLFELDLALAGSGVSIEIALDRALESLAPVSEAPTLTVVAHSVFPALTLPFDRDWFERMPFALRVRLLSLAACYGEFSGQSLGELYPYALARPTLFAEQPVLHEAVFSLSLFAGDFEGSAQLVQLATGDLRELLQSALAMGRGTFDASVVFVPPKKHEPVAVARLLQALLLLGRGGADDLVSAKRIATAGARKGSPFQHSAGWLKELIDLALGQNRDSLRRLADSRADTDCLDALFRGMFAIWSDSSIPAEYFAKPCTFHANAFDASGLSWLAAQYRACAAKLEQGFFGASKPNRVKAAVKAPYRPLYELVTAKEAWELSLEALERIAAGSGSNATAAVEAEERLLWRVSPQNLHIEPFLQTRKGGAFTRGRKLAIKHLLPGEPQLARLPEEDRKVAAHAREHREIHYGYPQVSYSFQRRAWLALTGHPRVEYLGSEQPTEVVQGTVQIVTQATKDGLILRLEPQDLERDLEVREEGGRLVVYTIDERALPLMPLLQTGLALPHSARERALATLGRLACLVPVQTSETTAARQVVADSRIWLRIVPRGTGLLISSSVRPLGATGPQLMPGVGARNLLGRERDEAVQTERDLKAEQATLARVLGQCPMLDGLREAGNSILLDDPDACLELLSALPPLETALAVEWPEGTPLRLRARVGRSSLRARIQRSASHFFAAGTLQVDEALSVELAELVALVAERPGRFARLANGDFIELERDLRETLELLSSARVETSAKGAGVALSRSAFAALEQLSSDGSGFELATEVEDYRARLSRAFSKDPKLPRGLEAELRDYQLEGFRWLARLADAELSGCLADDMGLGKTLQALALLLYRAKSGPAIVVAPTSVCDNWRREIARFAPGLDVRYFQGPDRAQVLEALGARSVVITSYTLLQQDAERLQSLAFATAILDEAQMIKNATSQRAKAACGLDAKVRFALTGTPVENQIGDLYSIFHFLLPDLLGTWPAFNRRFGAAQGDETGAHARRSLKRLLKPYLLRRTKAQVLEELPPLTEIEHRVNLGKVELALYEGIRQKALSALEAGAADPKARLRVLAEITRLRRLCCHPQLVAPSAPNESAKLDALMELLSELGEGSHRALVFSQFVDVLNLARQRLEAQSISYQYLDGSTPPARRAAAVDAFQSGEGEVFLISLKAGGFGLNLTAADYVIHLDPWWNPAVESQASDRAHRIGQTRPVTVYRLVATGTIEERIVELHRKKRALADSLLDESHAAGKLGPAELRALLEG